MVGCMQDSNLAVAEITVDELKEWIASLPNQVEGKAGRYCESGEEYVEFLVAALCRPDDVDLMWRKVATEMRDRLSDHIYSREGRIHWRKRLESEVFNARIVIRYDEDGPDFDYISSRRCFSDKDWKRVALYARMVKA